MPAVHIDDASTAVPASADTTTIDDLEQVQIPGPPQWRDDWALVIYRSSNGISWRKRVRGSSSLDGAAVRCRQSQRK
jgi:hypothetical protein